MRTTYLTACVIGALLVIWLATGQLGEPPEPPAAPLLPPAPPPVEVVPLNVEFAKYENYKSSIKTPTLRG